MVGVPFIYRILSAMAASREDQGLLVGDRDLLTVEQAASYLQLSHSSIRSYIRSGKLKAFRIAGKRKVLILRTDLLSLLEPTDTPASSAL